MPARLTVGVLTALAVLASVLGAAAPSSAAGSPGSGSCGASGYPLGYDISCQSATSAAAAPAAPAAASPSVPDTPCALYPVAGSTTQLLRVCPHGLLTTGRNAVNLLNAANTIVPAGGAAGGPPVTPQELLAWAQNELTLPLPGVSTAPPRGSDGLAGLPEWYWVQAAQWHPQAVRVQAGGVWAQVTATPTSIQIQPGPPGTGLSCPGPGTPYNPALPAAAQHSTCSYTYTQSSDGLPGDAYQVSVTVTWTATWEGAGGAGGVLPALGRTAAFALPVAEAQALNPGDLTDDHRSEVFRARAARDPPAS